MILCLSLASGPQYDYLIRRDLQQWFPIFPFNTQYWDQLRQKPVFFGLKSEGLKSAMKSLILTLIRVSVIGPVPRLTSDHQLTISPLQAASLLLEAFRISASSSSFASFNPEELARNLSKSSQSWLFDNMDGDKINGLRKYLSLHLPIDLPNDTLVSRFLVHRYIIAD